MICVFKAKTTNGCTHGGKQADGYSDEHTSSSSRVLRKRYSHHCRWGQLVYVLLLSLGYCSAVADSREREDQPLQNQEKYILKINNFMN
jgi:hypothetical protein